jgi:hypothetical protein
VTLTTPRSLQLRRPRSGSAAKRNDTHLNRRFFSTRFPSWRDADNEIKPPRERVVDLSAFAGGENREAGVFLDSLEEIVDLDVGVTVVAIMHLGAFAKERICFVEKEDRTTLPRRIEDASQILLRLADIFRDDGARIDTVQFFPRSRARVWAATSASIRLLPMSRTRTPFRSAGLRMGLGFVSTSHFAPIYAITSPRDARKRVGKRGSGSIQFSGQTKIFRLASQTRYCLRHAHSASVSRSCFPRFPTFFIQVA